MSDSELSEASRTPIPPDNELEQTLRREVVRATKASEEFTLRSIRTASEQRLGLPDGFYKGHDIWKDKSKAIVQNQIDNEPDIPSSPVAPKKSVVSIKQKKPVKRPSQERDPRPKKRQKKQSEELADLSEPLSDVASPSKPKERPRRKKEPTQKSAETKSPAPKKSTKAKPEPEKSETHNWDHGVAAGEQSESELSSLIDEEPQPKRKGKDKDSHAVKSKPKAAKSKPQVDEDPDQVEIKRLQGWLVKCGIRKLWGKELKSYETPKTKIKHLRDMLADVGMTGRYSTEKASQIKEARELAADIEAVQEGEQRWGTGDKEDADEEERPQRRLVRGAKNYDFLSSDGEETD